MKLFNGWTYPFRPKRRTQKLKGLTPTTAPDWQQYCSRRDLYLEAHRRAIFANINALLRATLNSDDPVIGFWAVYQKESSFGQLMGGNVPMPQAIAGRLNEFIEYVLKPRARGEEVGYGDRVNETAFEEPTIACGKDDAVEAERERVENGLLLADTLLRILNDYTYRDVIPQDDLKTLRAHVDDGLQAWNSDTYYG